MYHPQVTELAHTHTHTRFFNISYTHTHTHSIFASSHPPLHTPSFRSLSLINPLLLLLLFPTAPLRLAQTNAKALKHTFSLLNTPLASVNTHTHTHKKHACAHYTAKKPLQLISYFRKMDVICVSSKIINNVKHLL